MKDLLGREVLVDNKEGEIINICGYWYKVQFFNVNDGEVLIYQDDIKKYLV